MLLKENRTVTPVQTLHTFCNERLTLDIDRLRLALSCVIDGLSSSSTTYVKPCPIWTIRTERVSPKTAVYQLHFRETLVRWWRWYSWAEPEHSPVCRRGRNLTSQIHRVSTSQPRSGRHRQVGYRRRWNGREMHICSLLRWYSHLERSRSELRMEIESSPFIGWLNHILSVSQVYNIIYRSANSRTHSLNWSTGSCVHNIDELHYITAWNFSGLQLLEYTSPRGLCRNIFYRDPSSIQASF